MKELIQFVVVLIGVFAFRSSFAEQYEVPTGSMEPTILPGDRLIVSKSAYGLHLPFTDEVVAGAAEPNRGDVIVFRYPQDPSINYVKRVIGLPGDELVIENGWVRINGQVLALEREDRDHPGRALFKEHLDGKVHELQRLPSRAREGLVRVHVPAGHYFVMGDNRDNSNDSRVWGFVPRENVKGKALWVGLSLDHSQGLIPLVRWERFGNIL